jgi:hypothetical protein
MLKFGSKHSKNNYLHQNKCVYRCSQTKISYTVKIMSYTKQVYSLSQTILIPGPYIWLHFIYSSMVLYSNKYPENSVGPPFRANKYRNRYRNSLELVQSPYVFTTCFHQLMYIVRPASLWPSIPKLETGLLNCRTCQPEE